MPMVSPVMNEGSSQDYEVHRPGNAFGCSRVAQKELVGYGPCLVAHVADRPRHQRVRRDGVGIRRS